jgi:small subunit ribosomal protein S15
LARIHSHRRGKAHQTRPPSKRVPSWVAYSPEEIESLVVKLGKDGHTASEIGMILRDEYGIPLVKPILNKPIVEILREKKVYPAVPEDLQNLMNKAQRVQRHLQTNRGDRKNVHSLELIEAKLYRLVKYYKRRGILPEDFKYTTVVAQLK